MKDKKTRDREKQEAVMVLKFIIEDILAGRDHGLHLVYIDDRPHAESRSVSMSSISGLSAQRGNDFLDAVTELSVLVLEQADLEAKRLRKQGKTKADKNPSGRSGNFYDDPEVN